MLLALFPQLYREWLIIEKHILHTKTKKGPGISEFFNVLKNLLSLELVNNNT